MGKSRRETALFLSPQVLFTRAIKILICRKLKNMAKKYNLRLIGFVGGWDFKSSDVDAACKQNPEHLDILIDSTGGNVTTALSIVEAFSNHKSVHVHLRGVNASAATVVAMGAHRVTMARTGLFMIHNSRLELFHWDVMTEKDIQRKIEELDEKASMLAKTDLAIATVYSRKTGMSVSQALELMAKETWLTAEEAKKLGFVDEVTDYEDEKKKPQISACMSEAMAVAGMPVPEIKEESGSKLTKIINAIISKPKPAMPKFTFPAAFVAACGCDAEAEQSEDKTVAVAVDHIAAVDQALAGAESARAEAQAKLDKATAKITELEAEVTALKAKTPADPKQPKIVDTPKTENSLSEAVKIFNSLS